MCKKDRGNSGFLRLKLLADEKIERLTDLLQKRETIIAAKRTRFSLSLREEY